MIDTKSKKYFYCLITFTTIIVSLLFYFMQDYSDIYEFKYLITAMLGIVLMSQIVSLSFFRILLATKYFIVLMPVIVWFKSVFFFNLDIISLSPFTILLTVLNLLILFQLKNRKVLFNKLSKVLLLIWLVYFSKMIIVLFYLEQKYLILFALDYVEPFLFFTLIFQLSLLIKLNDFIIFFNDTLKKMIYTSIGIIALEMITRSGGKPWLFMIHGARKRFAGTSGDVTGGFGEPVTMGLFAAFVLFYFLFVYKNKLLFALIIVISFFSASKGVFLVYVLSVLSLIKSMGFVKFIKMIPKYIIIIAGIFSIPTIYLIYNRFVGTGNYEIVTSELNIAGTSFQLDLNLVLNIKNAIEWCNFCGMEWYMQFILFPFIGGVSGSEIIHDFPFLLAVNFLFFVLFVVVFIFKGNFMTKAIGIPLILLYSYYGAFKSNVYAYYFMLDKLPSLGYVPRNSPTMYFMIILVLLAIALNSKLNLGKKIV